MNSAIQSRRARLLLVDDDPRSLRAGARLATTYDVRTARSLAEVIEHLDRGFVPDLVISDFYLANETGGDVLREIERRCPSARRFLVSSSPESIPLQDAALAAAVLDKGAGAMNELLRDPHEQRR